MLHGIARIAYTSLQRVISTPIQHHARQNATSIQQQDRGSNFIAWRRQQQPAAAAAAAAAAARATRSHSSARHRVQHRNSQSGHSKLLLFTTAKSIRPEAGRDSEAARSTTGGQEEEAPVFDTVPTVLFHNVTQLSIVPGRRSAMIIG